MKLKDAHGNPWLEYNTPCSCCGMTFNGNPKVSRIQTAGNGIRVLAGKVGNPRTTDKLDIQHIATKQGDLTVAIKFAR